MPHAARRMPYRPMTSNHQDALQKIREEFQRFPLEVPARLGYTRSMMPTEFSELLAHALQYLCQSMKCDRAAVFLLNETTQTLQAQELIFHGDVMPGEEEIAILSNSPLTPLISGKEDLLLVNGALKTAYVPLLAFQKVFGVLRVERPKDWEDDTASVALLKAFAHELAAVLRGMEIAASERQQVANMRALHEVSNAIFRSLRLEEMLESVAQSLIHQLGYDRAKIYLMNREGDSLEGVLTMDQRGKQMIDREHFPLKRGVHPMVDLILGRAVDERLEKYRHNIMYIPLRARDENMGVLMVDNLLSQQEIPQDQIPLLEAIAGQLSMAIKNARLFQGVEELSITDGLTGLYILRYFKQRLKEELYRAERTHGQLSLMILDIDHFKRFNDTYGHPAGDTMLATIAERVLANARKVDLTARYGGDEFFILLPDTSPDEALLLAERLHHAVADEPVALSDGKILRLTVSIGIATYPTHAASIDELIKRADEALYWIKSHGRNRIRLYSPEIPAKT
jgi:diguanylate cyclase (GGDEF)-like protein